MSTPARTAALLGLAPLLGASDLLVKALGLALVALPLLAGVGALLPWLHRHLAGRAFWLGTLMLAGCSVALADQLLRAFAYDLHQALGPWLWLLALPCLHLALEAPGRACDGLRAGLAFSLLALLLGALREGIGHASLLAHGDWLGLGTLGLAFAGHGVPLFASAPGGLILLALLWVPLRRALP